MLHDTLAAAAIGRLPMYEILSQVPAFHSLPQEGLTRLLEYGRPRRFLAGETLMRFGEASDSLHVLASGRVSVERPHPLTDGSLVLAELGPGELVGEMGVLDGGPRSATVVALEETVTLELGAESLAHIVLLYPSVSAALLQVLSQRLRSTNDLVEQLLRAEANAGHTTPAVTEG